MLEKRDQVLDGDFVELEPCQHDGDCTPLNRRFFSKCSRYDCGLDPGGPFRCDVKAGRCVSARQFRNCKYDGACVQLDQLFSCEDGLCENITSVFDCAYDRSRERGDDGQDLLYNCRDKRNCIGLQGLFDCRRGICKKLTWPWHCERRCPSVSVGRDRNVLLLAGDRVLSATCDSAVKTSDPSEVIWTSSPYHTHPQLLTASCSDISLDGSFLSARDCVNGSLLPHALLLPPGHDLDGLNGLDKDGSAEANYTHIHDTFRLHGRKFPLDKNKLNIPFDHNIVIYNRTKLLINTEACVNTLMSECTEFYLEHRRDGRNYSSHDRFPCYYTPHHGNFVTTRFSLSHTRYVFLLCFSIPASLWILSCSCLFACSKMLRVDEDGRMRVRCRARVAASAMSAVGVAAPARPGGRSRRSLEDVEEDMDVLSGGAGLDCYVGDGDDDDDYRSDEETPVRRKASTRKTRTGRRGRRSNKV